MWGSVRRGWERGEGRDRGRERGGREKDEKCEYVSLIPRTEIVLNSLNSMYSTSVRREVREGGGQSGLDKTVD